MGLYLERVQKLSDSQKLRLAQRLNKLVTASHGRQQLIAYVETYEETTEAEFRSYLGQRLPEYMLPQRYIMLDKMPLNSNGKIDRQLLKNPLTTTQKRSADALEQQLIEIWSEVLEIECIDPDDDYFELSGDSITSIQIVAKAKSQHITLSPGAILEFPTIRQLAAHIRSSNASAETGKTGIATDTTTESTDLQDEDVDEVFRVLNLGE